MMIKGIPMPFGYEVEYMHSMYQLFLLKAHSIFHNFTFACHGRISS